MPEGATLVFERPREEVNDAPEIDELPAVVTTEQGDEWHFSEARHARVMLGLWAECGPFEVPREGAMPITVAGHSAAARAAWAFCRPGRDGERTRATVADLLGLDRKHSVSNYLGRMRWPWGGPNEGGETA